MPDMMNLDYLKLPYCELIISKVRGYNYVSSRWLAKKKKKANTSCKATNKSNALTQISDYY